MAIIDKHSSNAEKAMFFRSLFGGRGDVFARRYDITRDEEKPWTFFLPLWSTLIPGDCPSPITERIP